jgi:hypothetical protein
MMRSDSSITFVFPLRSFYGNRRRSFTVDREMMQIFDDEVSKRKLLYNRANQWQGGSVKQTHRPCSRNNIKCKVTEYHSGISLKLYGYLRSFLSIKKEINNNKKIFIMISATAMNREEGSLCSS